ncbi:transposase [Chryseobacterium soli]|uniref:Transposase n=1 Tax=Chryseobacterium soli TaxID=445961 RepID=A0A086A7M6_9FLAO|nr:transposase [Chryseobacterium soli]KFF12690.1 transposase [Chryseobacterium soli]MDV7699416.1 transposase [Chryseobacterium soli]
MNQDSKEKFKHIHIGKYLKTKVEEQQISQDRICNFLNVTDDEIRTMYRSESIDTYLLLRWSKLLGYDFFRLHSYHLLLYSPLPKKHIADTSLPIFRKNTYTKEIIDLILEMVNTGQKTKKQIINEYGIPKTTLLAWISKQIDKTP